MVNTWTSAALLEGYTGKGVALSVLIEPTRSVGDRITGYLDVNVRSNTEALGDELGIDVGPNVDTNWNQTATINTGLSFGVAGDAKQDDLAFTLSLLMAY